MGAGFILVGRQQQSYCDMHPGSCSAMSCSTRLSWTNALNVLIQHSEEHFICLLVKGTPRSSNGSRSHVATNATILLAPDEFSVNLRDIESVET